MPCFYAKELGCDDEHLSESGRKNPKAAKSLAAQDFSEKVSSLLGFLKTAVKNPCLPAIRRRPAVVSGGAMADVSP
jgi:uncharacterized membrane protein YkgB